MVVPISNLCKLQSQREKSAPPASFFIHDDWKCEHHRIICVQEYCSAFLYWKIAFQMLTFFFFFSEVKNKVSLLSAKHLRPVNSRGESMNKERKFVDIFVWWLISPTDFRPISTLPSPHRRPTELSQALCVSDQIEETREDNVRYYARLLGATFCSRPPGIRGLVHFPLPLPLPPFTRSLKHDCQCDSGSHLGQWLPSPPSRHPIPACLGLQTAGSDLLAQFPVLHGGTRPGTEVERLERGQKRGRGRTSGHIWTGISFHSFLSSRFLLIIRASGARSAWSEVRGEIQSVDKYWKWRLIILRGENTDSCCEVCI